MRELLGTQLERGMIVQVQPPGYAFIQMRVSAVDPVQHKVSFYSERYQWIATLRFDQRGCIYDYTGTWIVMEQQQGDKCRTTSVGMERKEHQSINKP